MRRCVKVFCAAFAIFFVLGGLSEYRARMEVSDKDFLLDTIASRFTLSQSAFLYRCGQRVLYHLDLDNNSLERVEYFSPVQPHVEVGLTHETVALLATGWGISEGAAKLRLSLGLTTEDKIAALLGGLSGYTAGRWVFNRTLPACDGAATINFLNNTTPLTLGRAILKSRLAEWLMLEDRSTVTLLVARLSSLHKAFNLFAEQQQGKDRSVLEDCRDVGITSLSQVSCGDFEVVDSVRAKLSTPDIPVTVRDYVNVDIRLDKIAVWATRHQKEVGLALSPHLFRGVTTKAMLIRQGDATLNREGTWLWKNVISIWTSVRDGLPGITRLVVLLIATVGVIVIGRYIAHLFPLVEDKIKSA